MVPRQAARYYILGVFLYVLINGGVVYLIPLAHLADASLGSVVQHSGKNNNYYFYTPGVWVLIF